ncbi:hypothetical protein KSB_88940 [Ktedonobacter robiniae]|uniref:Uncharacterized protein n=1 Tax=Ktedonobacter robiniae TaxID=2778365 RepID=A0ABQ3V5I2_9CHLR|nr:hypothetical protein KSB_88940 [Ktedonobacter robiniae]
MSSTTNLNSGRDTNIRPEEGDGYINDIGERMKRETGYSQPQKSKKSDGTIKQVFNDTRRSKEKPAHMTGICSIGARDSSITQCSKGRSQDSCKSSKENAGGVNSTFDQGTS